LDSVEFLIASDPKPSIPVTLGLGVFAAMDLELDFAARKARLYSQDHCPGNVVYWADTYAAVPLRRREFQDTYIVMELEGQKIETTIGTNASMTELDGIAAQKLFGLDLPSPDSDATSRQQFMELTTSGLSVMNAQVEINSYSTDRCRLLSATRADRAAGYSSCNNVFPLRLGLNVLSKMRIYIATKENMFYFTASDTTRARPAQ
jgi:hypothetical protein